MSKIKVGVIVGSARKNSYSGSVAKALIGFLPEQIDAEIIDITKLEIYNQDLDEAGTPAWEAFRASAKEAQAFLFVTPEHNRSIPALLKNALDVGSRPYGKSIWGGKPAAIVSVTPGATGAYGANHSLRQTATVLDLYTMQQPEAYIGSIHESLDENGNVSSEDLNGFLKLIAESFAGWAAKFVD